MRRFALSPRRLLAAAALGIVGALAFTTAANACNVYTKPAFACANGSVTVTWTLTNDYNAVVTIKDFSAKPGGVATAPTTIGKKGTTTVTQTVPADTTSVSISFTGSWKGAEQNKHINSGDVAVPQGTCVSTESPSPSPSASAPASASPSASPSKTAVAPVSSSPASGTGAGSTLPVTGTSLTWFIVAAVVLIGGGAALFFVSRRRRTNA